MRIHIFKDFQFQSNTILSLGSRKIRARHELELLRNYVYSIGESRMYVKYVWADLVLAHNVEILTRMHVKVYMCDLVRLLRNADITMCYVYLVIHSEC